MPINFSIDDYIVLSDDLVSGGTELTISIWANPTAVIQDGSLYNAWDDIGDGPVLLYAKNDTTDFWRAVIRASDLSAVSLGSTVDSPVTNGSWVNVLITYKRNDTMYLYVNNVQKDSGATPDLDIFSSAGITNFIGGENTASTRDFNGLISEVAIWNKVLTLAERTQLYNSKIKGMPLQIQSSNLVGYWPIDGGTHGTSADGQIIYDRSGNGNNGTGDDGANNTGLTWQAEEVLSYSQQIWTPKIEPVAIPTISIPVLYHHYQQLRSN